MEKYGVVEETEKTADKKGQNRCPQCGGELSAQAETGVSYCPNCGTKPFEPVERKS